MGLIAFGLIKTTAPRAVVGTAAPEFSLQTLDGRTLTSADLKGAPVVVNFWASWCVSCAAEAAELERAWKEYGPRGLRIVGVTYRDDTEAARAFVKEEGVSYPSIRDPEEELASAFGLQGVPETFFIDHDWKFAGIESAATIGSRNGTVIKGPIPGAVLRRRVEALLDAHEAAGARAPAPATGPQEPGPAG